METKFKEKTEKSINKYIDEKHSPEKCLGFIDGYEKALKDSKAPEMFEMLEEVVKKLKGNGFPMLTGKIEQLLKEATEL